MPPQTASIYIHIPFCMSKCHYCSFVSFPCHDAFILATYGKGVLRELTRMASHPWSREHAFTSLFLGGGTPTILPDEELAQIITKTRTLYHLPDCAEITSEANPNTINSRKLAAMLTAGANRLSIGVQSFSDRLLAAIGRSHSSSEAIRSYTEARRAGFDNISLDLIYGLPGQTLDDWLDTLKTSVELFPEHISIYELTVEPGTQTAAQLQSGKISLPGEEATLAMEQRALEVMARNGYERYEISNFARPGYRCRHNINYWQNGSYLGLGAGAVSCFSGCRIKNVDSPEQYLALADRGRMPFAEAELLSLEAGFRETVIMGLRMTEGVSTARLKKRFGLTPAEYYGEILEKLIRQKLIVEKNDFLRLTATGMRLANQVSARLV